MRSIYLLLITILFFSCAQSISEDIKSNYFENENEFLMLLDIYRCQDQYSCMDTCTAMEKVKENLLVEINCEDVKLISFKGEKIALEVKYKDVGIMQGAYYVLRDLPLTIEDQLRMDSEGRLIKNNVYWLIK